MPFHKVYRNSKVIKYNLPFLIRSSQLDWSKHALERMEERNVVVPKKAVWEFVGKTWVAQHQEETWSLRYQRKYQDDLIIVVVKQPNSLYKVITTYWEERQVV